MLNKSIKTVPNLFIDLKANVIGFENQIQQ